MKLGTNKYTHEHRRALVKRLNTDNENRLAAKADLKNARITRTFLANSMPASPHRDKMLADVLDAIGAARELAHHYETRFEATKAEYYEVSNFLRKEEIKDDG